MSAVTLDVDVLNELKELLEGEFDNLIDTFVRDATFKVEELVKQLELGNITEVRKLAHSVKGASMNLGVVRLSNLCHQVEQAAVNENHLILKDLIDEAVQEVKEACLQLAKLAASH